MLNRDVLLLRPKERALSPIMPKQKKNGMNLAHPIASCRGAPAGRFYARWCAAAIALLLLTAPARAGEVVIVLSGDATPYGHAEAGFRAEFADKRPVRTVQLKDVNSNGIDQTVVTNADAVVAVGTMAASYLHRRLPESTPLIYCMVADPAQAGLLEGTATHGVTTSVPAASQFQLAAEALPHARTLGILYKSDTEGGLQMLKNVNDALPNGWRVEAVAVDKYSSVADAIGELTDRKVDLIWTSLDAGIYDNATVRTLLLAALRNNIPVFGYSPAFVKAGALIGVGVDPNDQGKQAADMTARLFDHPNDAGLPVAAAPEQYQIALNLIVAAQIGVDLPQELIARANYVFKETK